MYIRISLRGICLLFITSRKRIVFELLETIATLKAKHYSYIISIRSFSSLGITVADMSVLETPFKADCFVVSRLGVGLAEGLSRFFFTTCKTLDRCFSRNLFFSQELHTSLRLYRGFGHISPFL